jgi:hypothetical protein
MTALWIQPKSKLSRYGTVSEVSNKENLSSVAGCRIENQPAALGLNYMIIIRDRGVKMFKGLGLSIAIIILGMIGLPIILSTVFW